MRVVVCDTGPILSLGEAELLHLLSETGRIRIPPSVESELQSLETAPEWLEVVALTPPFETEARAWLQSGVLDPGEAEAIALAKQIGADWLITDDAAARLVATREGLEVHGSLGLVLWAASTGRFDREAALNALDALSGSSLWISARVLGEARAAVEQLCSKR